MTFSHFPLTLRAVKASTNQKTFEAPQRSVKIKN